MQKQEMQAVIKIANMSKALPQSKNMVTVESLLTKQDKKRIDNYHIGMIAVGVDESAVFLARQWKVPEHAKILRDKQGQLLGIPVVAGG